MFNSQELDKETGYYFYNARHYDPEISRFVTADNVIDGEGDSQGWNRYSYVKGNPIRYKDPTGHCTEWMDSPEDVKTDEKAWDKAIDNYKKGEDWKEKNVNNMAFDDYGVFGNNGKGVVKRLFNIAKNPKRSFNAFTNGVKTTFNKSKSFYQQYKKLKQIRVAYNKTVSQIPSLNKKLLKDGVKVEERAKAAYDIRHKARLEARSKMDGNKVKFLEERDLKKYKNENGPTFEYLIEKNLEKGYKGDNVYEEIIKSSSRTDSFFNKLFGL